MLLLLLPLVFAILLGLTIARHRRALAAQGARQAGRADYARAMEEAARAASPAQAASCYDEAARLAALHYGAAAAELIEALAGAAQAEAAAGHAQEATARFDGAIGIARGNGTDPMRLAELLAARAEIHPDPAIAARSATEALTLIRRARGQGDPAYGRQALATADLLARNARRPEAEALYRELAAPRSPVAPEIATAARDTLAQLRSPGRGVR
ncbi:hypothetical protein [Thioclava atlantica]|uniref:Uncharacterized protein n=1 Tax=Thioclava atlantica TaxID=1317124 RepID=A0A085TUU0_9RHOB|nr:hypothetical protein [Thioclava atlantica]KFE34487.1 hypothetical protein DW2_13080 [Thioclava atlantica]